MHERFWHAPPLDMLRLLHAMILPRDIVVEGIQIARDCTECRQWASRLPKPLIKSNLATQFNETVQHDLFFLWDLTFMLLIDEAIRWKTGDHLESKEGSVLCKALLTLWIRFWGPMTYLLTDQEGGLLTVSATRMFERFGITRLLVGQGASHTKGLVERHIALTKLSMLRLKDAARKEGLDVTPSELCIETCMAQNLMLEYNGGTPQMALTGRESRGWYTPDSNTIESITGALQSKPDMAEQALRMRMLSKQCILSGLLEDRLAVATRMKQHKHDNSLLVPGQAVDIWRQPARKDEDGWRGPAELISVERKAGSGIVRHNGQLLLIPLQQLRKHKLLTFFIDMVLHSQYFNNDDQHINPQLMRDTAQCFLLEHIYDTQHSTETQTMHRLMDTIDGCTMGLLHWIGVQWNEAEQQYKYIPDETTVANNLVYQLFNQSFKKHFNHLHGVIYGNNLRRLMPIPQAKWGLLLRWPMNSRTRYTTQLVRVNKQHTFRGDQFQNYSTVLGYSFDHHESNEDITTDPVDMDDISGIPWAPDWNMDDDLPTPLKPDNPPDNPPQQPPWQPPQQPNPMDISDTPMQPPDSPQQPNDDAPQLPPAPPGAPPQAQQPSQPAQAPSLPQCTTPPRIQSTPPGTPINDDISTMDNIPQQHDDSLDRSRTPEKDWQQPTTIPQPSQPSQPAQPNSTARDRSRTPDKQQQPPNSSSTAQPSQPITTQQDKPTKHKDVTTPERPTARQRIHSPTGPLLPLLQPNESSPQPNSSSTAQSSAPAQPSQPAPAQPPQPTPAQPSAPAQPSQPAQEPTQQQLDDTIPYDDQQLDDTIPYDDQEQAEQQIQQQRPPDTPDTSLYTTYITKQQQAWNNNIFHILQHNEHLQHFAQEVNDFNDQTPEHLMYQELQQEFRDLFVMNDEDIFYDFVDGQVFRVDQSTAILTEQEMCEYSYLVHEADRVELEQFIKFKIFTTKLIQDLDNGSNIVDCVWVRKWAIKGQKVKSRMCARGCFDKQKYFIEKHSSTATRLSQRLVIVLGMCDGILHNPTHNESDITTESFDISGAFLQGLDYEELQKQARSLGYEYKIKRKVFVKPPENVWRHFRSMRDTPASLRIADKDRAYYVLECLKAMYGFADAPLMFQLALLSFLLDRTQAVVSVFDDNFLYWYEEINGRRWLTLVMTIHVDDLQLTGASIYRERIYKILTSKFGKMKRQQIPYTHAGIQLERISPGILRLHQDQFTQQLETYKMTNELKAKPAEPLPEDLHTTFRSLTCSCLWACQTREEELCQITSLQQKLKKPQVQDLMSINTVIKRLKNPATPMGLFYRRLVPPLRIFSISDASSANKSSDFATEGVKVPLGEDRIARIDTDKHDWLTIQQIEQLGGKFNSLIGLSNKSKRISHSTSHAETLAAAKTVPLAQIAALRLAEPEITMLHRRKLSPLELMTLQDKALVPIPVDHAVDCMDLWELSCGNKGIPQDKSQRLAILALREERRSLRLRRLFHISTIYMIADMLTKYSGYVSKSLLQLLTSGYWTIGGEVRVREHFGAKDGDTQQ